MYKNEHDTLNYQPSRYNPVDDFAKWYETNGKTKQEKPQDQENIYKKQIEQGNLDSVPSIMKIAYGLDKLKKAKEAEQAKKNNESDQ